MERRQFLKTGAALAAAGSMIMQCSKDTSMDRIGMTTVVFRMRFPQTRPENYPAEGADLTLLEIPEYFADRFGMHNVELWNLHFESQSPGYLADLQKALAKTHSTVINIQVDGPYNHANPDDAVRTKGMDYIKEWLDTSSTLQCSMRSNTGQGEYDVCLAAFRELTDYAEQKGVVLLIENHGGISGDPATHVRLINAINSPNLKTLPDFGNYAPEIRYEGLKTILPYAGLISAKTMNINADGVHTTFDFDHCMQLVVDSGYTGIYSAEYWDGSGKPVDYEWVADWMIEHIKPYC